MNPTHLLNLRIVVAALGESHQNGWWPSQFLSTIGLSYLTYTSPRSAFAAGVRAASLAARLVHDAAIGKGAIFHLFRLDVQRERELDRMLGEQAVSLEQTMRATLDDRQALLDQLQRLANGQAPVSSVGPVLIAGSGPDLLAKWATAYLQAFAAGQRVFPYMKNEGTGTDDG